ncbi:unnamed protein product [Blepharisma stoltei]|uniref:PH domain-containing protein n=1 Tax=Blepharisma stoltei TaxID=1481888 RepID=A0AAU9IKC6_9CILI|nr:unnamed protein product [Blepharisma stoltei]
MEGFLMKWTNYVYGWKRRYFSVKNGLISYSKNKDSKKKGEMRLLSSQIVKHPADPKRFSIEGDTISYYLKASSPKEASQWIQALKQAQRDAHIHLSLPPSLSNLSPRSPILPDNSAFTHSLALKLSEIWGIHAQMQEAVDMIPPLVIQSIPGLDSVLSLSNAIKKVASEALAMIDEEEHKPRLSINSTVIDEEKFLPRQSLDMNYSEPIFELEKPVGLQKVIYEEECKEIEEIEFEDAKSHYSDDSEKNNLKIIPHRKSLPVLRNPNQRMNIWKVVKDSIGKEFYKITVPVYFNEPLSFIQRVTEDMTYSEIIERACEEKDPQLRLALVACFAISQFSMCINRTMKPFNPLLGETFELETKGFRCLSEQVSHHPPIAAMHTEHPKYIYWGNTEVKTRFKGTYIQANLVGAFHLILKEFNDHFIFHKPNTNIYNFIMGKIYIDLSGTIEMSNFSTGDRATVVYKKRGMFEKVNYEIEGGVYDNYGVEKYSLEGKWNEEVNIKENSTGKIIKGFEMAPYPDNHEMSYYFSDFALQLNILPEHFNNLPPTDVRKRPDQRALENGNLKLAASEKWRLEEKQRDARKRREDRGIEYKPRWFVYQDDEWVYKGGYWEAKEIGDFSDLPDIF